MDTIIITQTPPTRQPQHSHRRIAASALRAMTVAHIPWNTLHAEGLDAMVLAGLEAVYLQGRTDAADQFVPLVLPQPAEPAEHDGIDWRCPGCGLDRWRLQRKADHRFDEMTEAERRCWAAQCGRREAWARGGRA